MDRDTIVALLPCYLCGDLPEDVSRAIQHALAQDPSLQGQLDALRVGRDACAEALAAVAPDFPEFEALDLSGFAEPPTRASAPAVSPASPIGILVALAACAALVLGGMSLDDGPSEEVALAAAADLDLAGPLPAVPRDALLAQGAPPALAMAPDLSAHGFELVAVRYEDGPRAGVVLTYEKDGQRFHCRIHAAFQTGGRPDAVVDAGGVLLRGFERGPDASVVSWTNGGRTCLFSGPVPVQEMLAMTAMRVNPARG
jgi:hypothetical protein